MKRTLLLFSILVCIGAVAFIYYIYNVMSQTVYISPESIEVTEFTPVGDEWVIRGMIDMKKEKALFYNKGFNGVDYREEDGRLYVSLRYGIVSGEPADSFEVFLADTFVEIEQVYLQGDSQDDVKLVWEE